LANTTKFFLLPIRFRRPFVALYDAKLYQMTCSIRNDVSSPCSYCREARN